MAADTCLRRSALALDGVNFVAAVVASSLREPSFSGETPSEMGLFKTGIEKEFSHYRREGILDLMDEVSYTTSRLNQDQPQILDAARKYRKRVVVYDVYGSDPERPSFVATEDGEWLTVEDWIERNRRRLPVEPRSPAEVFRARVAASGPDILSRARITPDLDPAHGDLFHEFQFVEAASRFVNRWEDEVRRLADDDIKAALMTKAADFLDREEGEDPDPGDPAYVALMNLGVAGYVWRCIEREEERGFGFVGEEMDAIYGRVASLGAERSATLFVAADDCLKNVDFALESPGGMLRGRDFLESGYEYFASDVLSVEVSDNADEQILRTMFFMGVVLRDVEKLVGAPPAVVAGGALQPRSEHLGADLFESDVDAYRRLAGWIVADEAGRPQLNEQAQMISTGAFALMLRYFDPEHQRAGELSPFGSAVARLFGEVVAGAYALARSEEWPELDADHARQLINDAAPVTPATADDSARWRATQILGGIMGQADRFQSVTSLFEAQPAYRRLESFAEVYVLRPGEEMASALRADQGNSEKVEQAVALAWRAGVTLALLERLGEIGVAE